MNNRPVILPTIVATPHVTTTIHIYPHVNGKASVVIVTGDISDGEQETYYKGNDEGLLITAFKDARRDYPEATVVWDGWEGWSLRAFENHVASNLCLNAEELVYFEGDSGIPVHELIVR
jgi:hypothetical protein